MINVWGAVSSPTCIHFGLRKGLRTEPLHDVEISVFVCVYVHFKNGMSRSCSRFAEEKGAYRF